MSLWPKRDKIEEALRASAARTTGWCDRCRSPHGPLTLFENGQRYCVPCGERVREELGIRPRAEREADRG